MHRTAIFGASLDVGNRGVLALGTALAQLISDVRQDTRVSFHYWSRHGGTRNIMPGAAGSEVSVFNCRLSPSSKPSEHIAVILLFALLHRLGIRSPARANNWLRSLLAADFVGDIFGGDSFSDIYGFSRFVSCALPLVSALLLERDYVLLPQTYGPFRSPLTRWAAAVLLRRASEVLTRDQRCGEVVRLLSGRHAAFCPDVAFGLKPEVPRSLEIYPEVLSIENGDPTVGVNVSGLLFQGGYSGSNMFGLSCDYRGLIKDVVLGILRDLPVKVLLIPHVFGSSEREEEACRSVMRHADQHFPGRVAYLASALNEREVKWLIGRVDLMIASRMHACIAALSQAVPAVGLAYSDKFVGVFESVGLGGAVADLRTADTEAVLERIKSAYSSRTETRQLLEKRMVEVRQQLVETFRDLVASSSRRRSAQVARSPCD